MFFAGGRTIDAPYTGTRGVPTSGQTQVVEQALVHFLIPEMQNHEVPIVMIPGLGLTSYIFMSTPDGRQGWAQTFARNGFAVYVFDEPTNAISSFDVSPFNAAKVGDAPAADQPSISIWTSEPIWPRWGFGPEFGVPFDNTRYPVEAIDQFLASFTPRWSDGTGGRFAFRTKAAGLVALLEKIGPAIIMMHSAAGTAGFEATRLRPDLVKGIVVLEPVGCPTDETDVVTYFADKPFLAVYADFVDFRGQTGRLESCQTTAQLINDNGGVGGVINLPEMGIFGNSHLMMQDNNSDAIAEEIISWINTNVDTKTGMGNSGDAPEATPWDVNGDGTVNIFDLVIVGGAFESTGKDLPADVNRDEVVDILDLVAVAGHFAQTTAQATPAAPPASSTLHAELIQSWLVDAKAVDDGSEIFQRGLALLESLLNAIIPDKTALFLNYPNPFNPETWIPYQLRESSKVTIAIYDSHGRAVRQLYLGAQQAGFYRTRDRATYWDGRNEAGETAASGIYFAELKAGTYRQMQRIVMLK